MQNKTCEKCEEWGPGFVILICSLYAVGFYLGLYFSYAFSFMAAVGFILVSIANLFCAFYTTCRHCYYYGKRCYLAIGLLVPYFFEKNDEPISIMKEASWVAVFIINMLYPLFFIFKANSFFPSIIYSIGYLIFPVSVIILVHKYSCPKCKNEGCWLNPDRVR